MHAVLHVDILTYDTQAHHDRNCVLADFCKDQLFVWLTASLVTLKVVSLSHR